MGPRVLPSPMTPRSKMFIPPVRGSMCPSHEFTIVPCGSRKGTSIATKKAPEKGTSVRSTTQAMTKPRTRASVTAPAT